MQDLRLLVKQYWYFLLIIPPIIIPILVTLIADTAITSQVECCIHSPEPDAKVSPAYLHAFVGWICSQALMFLVGIIGIFYSWKILSAPEFLIGNVMHKTAIVLACLVTAGMLIWRLVERGGMRSDMMHILFKNTLSNVNVNKQESGIFEFFISASLDDKPDHINLFERISAILTYNDLFWMPAAVFLVMAAITCITPKTPQAEKNFHLTRNRYARNTLYFSAALLFSGMLAVNFLLSIPADLVNRPDNEIIDIIQLSKAVKFLLGYSYTLIILSVYLPVAFRLYQLSHSTGTLVTDDSVDETTGKKHAFMQTWLPIRSYLIQILAILSPLLADPTIKFLGDIVAGTS